MSANNTSGNNDPIRLRNLQFMAVAIRRQLLFHQQLGIEYYPAVEGLHSWSEEALGTKRFSRKSGPESASPKDATPQTQIPAVDIPSNDSFAQLSSDISACEGCDSGGILQQLLKQPAEKTRLMIVGDYPDKSRGEHFLFGKLEDEMLKRMIAALKLRPEEVYITNFMKCALDRATLLDKGCLARCETFLSREILLVNPPVICAMGDMAAQALVGIKASVPRLRGSFRPYPQQGTNSVEVMVTFHPRFLLANPEMKRATWEDLQKIAGRYLAS